MPINRKYAERYSSIYTIMKFISKDSEYRSGHPDKKIQTSEDEDIKQALNKISISHIFDHAKYDEISNHLGLYNYH